MNTIFINSISITYQYKQDKLVELDNDRNAGRSFLSVYFNAHVAYF